MKNSSGEWSIHRLKTYKNSCRDCNSWLGVVPTEKMTVDYPTKSVCSTATSMCSLTYLGKFAWGQEFLVSKMAAMHGRVLTVQELQRICKAIKIWSTSLVAAVWSRRRHCLRDETAVSVTLAFKPFILSPIKCEPFRDNVKGRVKSTLCTRWRHKAEWSTIPVILNFGARLGASDQLNAPVALCPEKDTAPPTERGNSYLRKYERMTFLNWFMFQRLPDLQRCNSWNLTHNSSYTSWRHITATEDFSILQRNCR